MSSIPSYMKRLVILSSGPRTSVKDCNVVVETVSTPRPAPGEVLIEVAAAPINTSDFGSWLSGSSNAYPLPMGKEGCGIVVATNGFLAGLRFPIGSKVGFVVVDTQQGSYSEYVTANAMESVVSMPHDKPIEDCASFFVNPFTACGILDTAKNEAGSHTIVLTAAASHIGQMINKLAHSEGMQIINVVREEEQAQLLRSLGANHVITTQDNKETWKEELKTKIEELGATCAFDAVAGEMTGTLLEVLPDRGTCYVYGRLSQEPIANVRSVDIIQHQKTIRSFLLSRWISRGGHLQTLVRSIQTEWRVKEGLRDGGWCSSNFYDTTLESAHDDLVAWLKSGATGNTKLRIRFNVYYQTPP